MLGIIYFFAEEFLLQQAKLLWDDIRDIEQDKKRIYNKDRYYVQGFFSKRTAILHVFLRWTFSLALGYLIGGVSLLILFLLISLHQILYELWGKPRGDKLPKGLLIFISFSTVFRFVAGILAIEGSYWSYTPFLLLIVVFYFYSFGSWRFIGK